MVRGARAAQPQGPRRALPAGHVHGRHRRVRARARPRSSRSPVPRPGPQTVNGARERAGRARLRSRARRPSTRSSRSTRAPSAGRRAPTRPPTRACSGPSGSCSRACPRRACGATARAASASTSRAAAARTARATASSRSRCSSCRTSTCPARCAAASATTARRWRSTTAGHSIADVLEMTVEEALDGLPAGAHRPQQAPDARRRGPRLHPAGPAGHDALGRRGAARQAGHGAVAPGHRPDGLPARRAHHRASTSRTWRSCSRCSTGWWTPATRSSSSSTTWTSSRPPTGSSTWARRVAPGAAGSSPTGTPEEVAAHRGLGHRRVPRARAARRAARAR